MITLIVLAYAVSLCSGCPYFASSLENGQIQQRLNDQTTAQLIANGYLIALGQPGGDFANNSALAEDLISIYQKSNALLIAQQFYMNQNCDNLSNMTNAQKLQHLSGLSETIPLSERCTPVPVCQAEKKYVTDDGSCNNLEHPKWGQSFSPYVRMVPAVYDDGIYTVRKSVTNAHLPSAKHISNVLLPNPGHQNEPLIKQNYASALMTQYVTHDIAFQRVYQNSAASTGLRCCPRDYKRFLPQSLSYYGCLPIEVPSNDPVLSEHDMSCMNFVRAQTTLTNDCKLGAAQHVNAVTHVLDNSAVYGSNSSMAFSLRTKKNGKLILDDQFQILPKKNNCTGRFCYYTPDTRATFFPTFSLMHSIYFRFHNKIADKLSEIHTDWQDEQLYHEARRISNAVYQKIVYNEWLPLVIGKENALKHGLTCGSCSTYCGAYNASVDPSTLAEFGHSVSRQFHTSIPNKINFYNEKYKNIRSGLLSDMLNGAALLETNYNDVLRGLIIDRAHYGTYSEEMRHNTFKGNTTIGVDMAAADIARGRDTGISPYHVYLNLAVPGGHEVRNWNDLNIVFSKRNIAKLKKVYASPLDIDFTLGLLLEKIDFSYTGLVNTYVMVEQFKRKKFGDRFFYSFQNGANPFTAEQISEINKQTWASVLCENTDIKEMLVNAFQTKSSSNKFAKCNTFPSLNLNLWANL